MLAKEKKNHSLTLLTLRYRDYTDFVNTNVGGYADFVNIDV